MGPEREAAVGGGPSASAPSLGGRGLELLRQRLGTGGMGVVYLAHDPALERDVAIKVLRRDAACRS